MRERLIRSLIVLGIAASLAFILLSATRSIGPHSGGSSRTDPLGKGTPPVRGPAEDIGCTMEAKLCQDGSAVGRSGPNCEFAPCPGETNDFRE